LWTLEDRRSLIVQTQGLLEVFKMYQGFSLTPFSRFFTISNISSTRAWPSHSCQRVIERWNSLRQSIINDISVNSFKNGLDAKRDVSTLDALLLYFNSSRTTGSLGGRVGPLATRSVYLSPE